MVGLIGRKSFWTGALAAVVLAASAGAAYATATQKASGPPSRKISYICERDGQGRFVLEFDTGIANDITLEGSGSAGSLFYQRYIHSGGEQGWVFELLNTDWSFFFVNNQDPVEELWAVYARRGRDGRWSLYCWAR